MVVVIFVIEKGRHGRAEGSPIVTQGTANSLPNGPPGLSSGPCAGYLVHPPAENGRVRLAISMSARFSIVTSETQV